MLIIVRNQMKIQQSNDWSTRNLGTSYFLKYNMMSNELILSKLQLLSDQLNDLEYSGFYTEKEIDSKSYPLYQELETLQNHLCNSINQANLPEGVLGLEPTEIAECSMLISSIKNRTNPVFHIQVIDPQILTPKILSA